jgi:hypothetical protein
MGDQVHRRLSKEFVEEVLEAFNERRMKEEIACELLGMKQARLYRLRQDWLPHQQRGEVFQLWNRSRNDFHRFLEIEN